MKLYNVPRQSYIRRQPDGECLFFDHVDGMYSFCKLGGNVVHFFAGEEVEIISKEEYENYLAFLTVGAKL